MYTSVRADDRSAPLNLRYFSRTVFCAGFLCASQLVSAASVLAYDFDDGVGGFLNAPASSSAGLSGSAWSDLHGTLTSFAGNPGRAVAAKSWHSAGNAFMLDIVIAPGFELTLDGFSFDQKASSSGPLFWQLFIGPIQAATGAAVTSFTTESGTLALTGLTDTISIVLAGGGASSTSGTWRIDNFDLSGSVQTLTTVAPVPVPGALLLMASALGFGGLIRRRSIR